MFDSHAHYDDARFDGDRDALLAVANEIEQDADGCTAIAVGALYDYVDRIREALGVSE